MAPLPRKDVKIAQLALIQIRKLRYPVDNMPLTKQDTNCEAAGRQLQELNYSCTVNKGNAIWCTVLNAIYTG
ncbi:MAG: hypothetical protein R2778_08555 [Saprospiraceae bacterium]